MDNWGYVTPIDGVIRFLVKIGSWAHLTSFFPRKHSGCSFCYNPLKLKLFAPENRPTQKKTIVFQPSIFRCHVRFQGGYSWLENHHASKKPPTRKCVKINHQAQLFSFQIPSTKVFLKTVNKKKHYFFQRLVLLVVVPSTKTKNMSELYMSVLIGTCSSIFHRVIPLDSHKTKGWQITSFSQQIPTLTIFHRMHFCHWSHPKSGAPIKKCVFPLGYIYIIYVNLSFSWA